MDSAHGKPIVGNGLAGARGVNGLFPCRSHLSRHPDRCARRSLRRVRPLLKSGTSCRLFERAALVVVTMAPEGPTQPRELVGDGDGGTVVAAQSRDLKAPGAQAVLSATAFGGGEQRAAAVDQQGPQVAVTALADAT